MGTDVLFRRVPPRSRKGKGKGKAKTKAKAKGAGAEAEAEAEQEREGEAEQEGEVLPEEDDGGEGPAGLIGSLYTPNTVDAYVAAVIELYDGQVTHGLNRHPHPRGPALTGLLRQRRRERDVNDRESFKDRGAGGIVAGYTGTEFMLLQRELLKRASEAPQVSLVSFIVYIY